MNKEEKKSLKFMQKEYKKALYILESIQYTNTYKKINTTKEEVNEKVKEIKTQLKIIDTMLKENK